jgi:hypothetical protein
MRFFAGESDAGERIEQSMYALYHVVDLAFALYDARARSLGDAGVLVC